DECPHTFHNNLQLLIFLVVSCRWAGIAGTTSGMPGQRTAGHPWGSAICLTALLTACGAGSATPWQPSVDDLGARVAGSAVRFAVYSSSATAMSLLLCDDPEVDEPSRWIELERAGTLWFAEVEGAGAGQHYGYVAWGPNWPKTVDWKPGSESGFVA